MTHEILAAGAVLWRRVGPDVEVCLVHRPRYDDWSLPKGKVKHGESMAAGAVREVAEETGVRVRLGPWLRDVRYLFDGAPKLVRYWAGEARSAGVFTPNDEVDELAWLSTDAAKGLLSYPHDADVVERFVEVGAPTSVVLLVRHAKAGTRADWDGDDDLRPLTDPGREQAEAIAELLPHYGPDRIGAAPLVRCQDTVAPLAAALGLPVVPEPELTEAQYDINPAPTMVRLRMVTAEPGVTVVCSQGGVIPDAVASLVRDAAVAVDVDPRDVPSKKGSIWVLSLRDGALVAADYVKRPGR